MAPINPTQLIEQLTADPRIRDMLLAQFQQHLATQTPQLRLSRRDREGRAKEWLGQKLRSLLRRQGVDYPAYFDGSRNIGQVRYSDELEQYKDKWSNYFGQQDQPQIQNILAILNFAAGQDDSPQMQYLAQNLLSKLGDISDLAPELYSTILGPSGSRRAWGDAIATAVHHGGNQAQHEANVKRIVDLYDKGHTLSQYGYSHDDLANIYRLGVAEGWDFRNPEAFLAFQSDSRY